MKVKSGSSLYPWIELRIPVRFKVPLNLRVELEDENGDYREVFTKQGHKDDVIDIAGLDLPVGYKIKGYKKNGACEVNENSGKYKMTFFTQNVTLKFDIDQIKYTIAYDRNGDDSAVTGNIASKSVKYGASTVLKGNSFKHTKGYKFSGWNTKPDGTGTAYAPKDTVTKLSSVNGDIVTLYAIWKDKDGNLVTASLFSNGSMGIKIGIVLSMVVALAIGATVSLRKRKTQR